MSQLKPLTRSDLETYCNGALAVLAEDTKKITTVRDAFKAYLEKDTILSSAQFMSLVTELQQLMVHRFYNDKAVAADP